MASVETRDDSLSTLPEGRKKETSEENRLAASVEHGDGRIGLDGNEPAAGTEDNCRQANVEQSAVLETNTELADAVSSGEKITSVAICDNQVESSGNQAAMSAEASSVGPAQRFSHGSSSSSVNEADIGNSQQDQQEATDRQSTDPAVSDSEVVQNTDHSGGCNQSDCSSTPMSDRRPIPEAPARTEIPPGFPGLPPSMYSFGPYFANPFMAPFVAHLPQAQGNELGSVPLQHSAYSEPVDGKNGRFAASYSNAEFVAHAKYYRELLQQYLRSMENASCSSEADVNESVSSSSVNLKFDPETGAVKLTSAEIPPVIDRNVSNRAHSEKNSTSPPTVSQSHQSHWESDAQMVEMGINYRSDNSRSAAIQEVADSALGIHSEDHQSKLARTAETSEVTISKSPVQAPNDTAMPEATSRCSDEPPFSQMDRSAAESESHATALIKKQMLEIEKQILRNAQNQHTRKMDSKEVEAFLSEQRSASYADAISAFGVAARTGVSEQQGTTTTPGASGSAYQVGPNLGSRATHERGAVAAVPTALPLQFRLPAGYVDPFFGQATSAVISGYSAAIPWHQNLYYPAGMPPTDPLPYGGNIRGQLPYLPGGIAQLPLYGSAIGNVSYHSMPQANAHPQPAVSQSMNSEESNFRPEFPKPSAVQPSPSSQTAERSCVAAIELSAPSSSGSSSALSSVDGTPLKSIENVRKFAHPCDSASIDSIGSFRETDDDSRWVSQDRRSSGNHADDEEEPVWVLRESYVRKLKREEERKALKERYESKRLEQATIESADKALADSDDNETDKLLGAQQQTHGQKQNGDVNPVEGQKQSQKKPKKKKEVIIHEPAVLIEGVLFRAQYLGSTQLDCDGRPSKATRMMQAQEAVARIKAPDGENQPCTDVDLFISTEKIMVLNSDLQDSIMMDHPLRTISYIADIGDLVVLMARRVSQSSPDSSESIGRRSPKIMCHVFESDEAQFIAQSIGQAFQVAYMEFLRANGIEDTSCMRDVDYQEVLNAQEMFGEELEMFARKETERDVVVPKQKNEILGVVIVESGWGSMLPTVVIANMMPGGPAARSNQLNIGDHIITINGISLVGLPLSECQNHVRSVRHLTAVKLTVVRTAPVVEVRMRRPDAKYQLGFSVQNGVICSLLRGGIGERGGVRVGHRIIEINSQSVVAVPHETVVRILASAVGEIYMKTMPTSMYRLLTGQETPNYL